MAKESSNVPRLKPTYRLYTQCNKVHLIIMFRISCNVNMLIFKPYAHVFMLPNCCLFFSMFLSHKKVLEL